MHPSIVASPGKRQSATQRTQRRHARPAPRNDPLLFPCFCCTPPPFLFKLLPSGWELRNRGSYNDLPSSKNQIFFFNIYRVVLNVLLEIKRDMSGSTSHLGAPSCTAGKARCRGHQAFTFSHIYTKKDRRSCLTIRLHGQKYQWGMPNQWTSIEPSIRLGSITKRTIVIRGPPSGRV